MSYNFKGRVHSWPRSASICSELWNKSVYLLEIWYCVSGLTCRGCFPFMSRKAQGCPLGPWCKSLPHIFLNYLGPQSRNCKGPRQGLSGGRGCRIEGRFPMPPTMASKAFKIACTIPTLAGPASSIRTTAVLTGNLYFGFFVDKNNVLSWTTQYCFLMCLQINIMSLWL